MEQMEWVWLAVYVVTVVATGMLLFYVYVVWRKGRCRSNVDLTGKTVLVTGANSGVGYWTALLLAKRNARVVLGCRNVQTGQEAVRAIVAETNNNNVVVRKLDLSLMKSVREFVKEFLKGESRLDILVNNAGVLGLPKTITDEGLEMGYATNHFGPFLLTNLLLDLIMRSKPSRIVNVSSTVHLWCREIEFDNLKAEKSYSYDKIYLSSKLANVLFTMELAARLKNTGVTVNCLHPGTVSTGLFRSLPILWHRLLGFIKVFFKTAEEGAQTSLYCAISEDLEGVTGKYFEDCKEAKPSHLAKDIGLVKKLWEISEIYTGLNQ